jgi:hypothetical protein
VVKANHSFLRANSGYLPGDPTDLRVSTAVVECIARHSRAGRVTLAEIGSYRSVNDPDDGNAVKQDGARVDARTFEWGPDEYPGFDGGTARNPRQVSGVDAGAAHRRMWRVCHNGIG